MDTNCNDWIEIEFHFDTSFFLEGNKRYFQLNGQPLILHTHTHKHHLIYGWKTKYSIRIEEVYGGVVEIGIYQQ